MKNIIQFRKGFVNLPNAKKDNRQLAMTVAAELMQLGYLLDASAIDNLSSAEKTSIVEFHGEVIPWLKNLMGANRSYRPFWKGFPEEVMEKSEMELWIHQIVHYFSNGSYEPSEWTKTRPTAFENSAYTKITSGDEDTYLSIFTDLVSVNQSLTPEDLSYVKYFVESGAELRFPPTIPFKENLCTLAGMGLNVPVKTVTDVLRIAVHMSGGDISMPKVPNKLYKPNRWSSQKAANPLREKFKFKKFSRKERKLLLSLLEKTNCDVREFALKDNRWIRLGEILHPGEYREQFPKAFAMFEKVRNEKVRTWYGEVDSAFASSYEEGLKKLSERPGEMVRRIDMLLRKGDNVQKSLLFKVLSGTMKNASNKVIYETISHFSKRNVPTRGRSIMVKGSRKRTSLPELPAIPSSDVNAVTESLKLALSEKFEKLPPLGKVFIDENLSKIPLPSNMRSMNAALKPRIRGERTPVGNPDAKVIRAFVHWFDEHGNQDIDLSAIFLGMGKVDVISWNGGIKKGFGFHSGDIRHRQGACAEYIDIDIRESLKAGFRYVLIDARNFNGGSLESITDCVFGYMEREFPMAGEIFVPSTLANTLRLTSESANTHVALIDLEALEFIFLDIDSDSIPVATHSVDVVLEAIKPYMEKPAFSVFDLLSMHAKKRGTVVNSPEEADITLKFEDFSSSYVETLKWMGI
jgi:hypothetical protein